MGRSVASRMRRVRRRAFERQGGLCHWCKRPMIWKTKENAAAVWDHPLVCTGDHLVFKSHGGTVSDDNIVAACRECNNARHPAGLEWVWLRRTTNRRVTQVGWGPWPEGALQNTV